MIYDLIFTTVLFAFYQQPDEFNELSETEDLSDGANIGSSDEDDSDGDNFDDDNSDGDNFDDDNSDDDNSDDDNSGDDVSMQYY